MAWPSNTGDLFADVAFPMVVGVEGSYDITREDRGNWTSGQIGVGTLRGTKYGISAAAFPTLDIANLTLEVAQSLYRHLYWRRICADSLPPRVAVLLFDGAVNQGQRTAVIILQTLVGVEQDGFVGPQTLAAVAKVQSDILFIEIEAQRLLAYARAAAFDTFGLGWMRRIATVSYRTLTQQIPA